MSFMAFTLSAASLSGRGRLSMILTKDHMQLSAPSGGGGGGWKKCQSTTIGENVPSLTLVLLVGTTNVGGASAAVGSSNRAQRPLAAVLVCNLTEFVFRLRL